MKCSARLAGPKRPGSRLMISAGVMLAVALAGPRPTADAEQLIQLRNGMTIRGSYVEIGSLNQNPFAAGGSEVQTRPIWMVDDGLRRTYIHRRGMVAAANEIPDLGNSITLKQPTPLGGKEVAGLGQILSVSPFNEYGRRQIVVRGPEGESLPIFQGVTELNARYAKVEGLKARPSYIWDMRVATRSLDSATLRSIFRKRMDQEDLDQRLEVVRFFIEAERYGDAHEELSRTIKDFPEEEHLEAQLVALTERQGDQLLEEAEMRREVGQYHLARQILETFPSQQLGRVSRLKVQDALAEMNASREQIESLKTRLRGQVQQLKEPQAQALQPIVREIAEGLSPDTLPRLSDYVRLGEAETLPVDNRVALAVSGWLLGSGSGQQNLRVATSLVEVRDLVAEFLGTSDAQRREAILQRLKELEGAEPEYVAQMLPLLLPPLPFPEGSASETVQGMYQIGLSAGEEEAPSAASDPAYVIQLPPEYNPLRSYPCILALHPMRGTPQQQLQWWAGPHDEEMQARMGQASRHGFIVVAPRWSRPRQSQYEYTPREHGRVLAALRDAMRRASIDSDRVFITGHGNGATAAWDIALAHPDLWAGMISISGEPGKTIPHYEENARYVPLYLVMGEKDGAPPPLSRNGPVMDDYMDVRTDAMVVMYRGRGREFFYDEIHHLFEWMRLPAHRRQETPAEIEAATMRHGDRFFWWLEMDRIMPQVAVNPILWDQAERLRAGKISASLGNQNQIRIGQAPSERFTVWLAPHMGIDMSQRITVRYRSRRVDLDYDGDLRVMLEDARTRADRKRPYWAKVQLP